MIHIAHYHHYSWKRRRELGLPALEDPSDLPRPLRDRSDRRSSSSEVDTGTSPSPAGTGTGTGTGTDMAMDVGMETGLTETGQRKSSNSGISSPSQFQPSSPRPGQSPSTSSLAHLQPSAIAGAGAPSSSDSQSQSQSQSKSRSHSHHFSRSRSTNRDLEAALESAQDSYAYADAVSLAGSTLKKSEGEVVVLSAEQQAKLVHHEKKFHASHTFYRPHETVTHRVSERVGESRAKDCFCWR